MSDEKPTPKKKGTGKGDYKPVPRYTVAAGKEKK